MQIPWTDQPVQVAMPPGRPSAVAVAKRQRDIRILSFSDVHLGHPQTPTHQIIKNLRQYVFPPTEETAKIDLILLGGDFFDEGLMYNDPDVQLIEGFMLSVLLLCVRENIVLRVTEGTVSHDRGQSRHFLKLIEQHNLTLDFRYVKEIEVEKIASLGISILYVPDFTPLGGDRMWARTLEALSEAGLKSVDYANIHGAFTYQMPPMEHAGCHSMDRFLSIVDQYIFTCHIHIPSIYDRIYCNGSTDRLNHGEEEAKGYWRALIRQNGEDDFTFVVNEGAKIYKTVDVTGLEINAAHAKLKKELKGLPKLSAIRLLVERNHPILTNLAHLKATYSDFIWSTKLSDKKEAQAALLVDMRRNFKEVPLTPANVTGIVLERLAAKGWEPAKLERAKALIGDHLQ